MNAKARRLAVLVAAHLAFAGAAFLTTRPSSAAWERSWLDAAFRLRGPRATKAPAVIAAIDDKSLAEIGAWPWPRKRSAELIDGLTAAGAATIAYDVMFAEPRGAADDRALVEATRRSGRVVHAYVATEKGPADPIPGLAAASAGLGSLAMRAGPMASRCLPLFDAERGAPTMGAAAAARQLGATTDELRARRPGPICLNLRGPRPYALVSAADILKNRLTEEQKRRLRGAVVFVGFVSDAVAFDQWASPFDAKASGVEIHATVFDNLVSGDPLTRTGPGASFLLLYLGSLAAALPFLLSRTTGVFLGGAAALAALAAAPVAVHWHVAPYGAIAAAAAASYLACLTVPSSFRG